MSSGDFPSDQASLQELGADAASTLAGIGLRVREFRLLRRLTLRSLARQTGLSISMISLVERGKASPSIGTLIIIASALDVTMSDLLSEEAAPVDEIVVRQCDAKVTETSDVLRRLFKEDRKRGLSIAVNEFQPHAASAPEAISHAGFEYGVVLEGTLTVEVDGASYVLNAGDLIAYVSERQHRIVNTANRKARSLWINFRED